MAKVANELGRSIGGIYKILKEESYPVRKRRKVDARHKEGILRLYYEKGESAPDIAKLMLLSKQTILYWLKRSRDPVAAATRQIAGTRRVKLLSGKLDLLPFVGPTSLRWADDYKIMMRKGNSKLAVTSRFVDAKNFFRLAGFYLAEGDKTESRAGVSNTNFEIVAFYHQVVVSFVRTEVRTYDTPATDIRAAKKVIAIGGICLKTLLLNAIDGILDFLGGLAREQKIEAGLGLCFMNGCSDGDGSVARSKQKVSLKPLAQLRLTEGRMSYAAKLLAVFRRILGVGYMYKPRKRNYYEVIASLSSQRAALLLKSGFFSWHPENRRRLASKALDSAYLSRFVLLYSLFGSRSFSGADLTVHTPSIKADFVGRSVVRGQLVPRGVVRAPKGTGFHWYRLYGLSNETQVLAKMILESMRGSRVTNQTKIQ